MTKEDLQKLLAEEGYKIGFAANLNFATYDITKKVPRLVSFVSIVISILGLAYNPANSKWITIPILIMSIWCIYTERYADKIKNYEDIGKKNTEQLNKLKILYLKAKDNGSDINGILSEYEEIVKDFQNATLSDQIRFANCYAHYKFFLKKNTDWMNEQLHFGLWRDKMPESVKIIIILFIITFIIISLSYYMIIISY